MSKKVILGGTFDILHKGHFSLLKKAFSLGEVKIGLTSDEFAEEVKQREVNLFEERKKTLKRFVKNQLKNKVKIVKIKDIFGPALKENFDFIVVSSETFSNAIKINKERLKIKKRPLKIIKVPLVLAKDKKPISCTRILNGEIDEVGRICVFCQIVNGKKECLKLFENKKFLAFLDKNPRNLGHTLVIPKEHFRWVWDVPCVGEYFEIVKKMVFVLKKVFQTDRVLLPILGDEVKHAHIHLIPRFKKDRFFYLPPKIKKISKKKLLEIKERIENVFKENYNKKDGLKINSFEKN